MARKGKAKKIPESAGNANQLQTKGIELEDPNKLRKKHKSPSKLAYERKRNGLRTSAYIREKDEEDLRTGMSICEDALRAKGFEVKQEEDKAEKFEFDLEHVKKVTFGGFSYPSGSPSEPSRSETGSVSSHYPVRGIMRKFTRKLITKAIKKLEEKVQIEEDREKVDVLFERLYARNDRATRRAKGMYLKIMGKKYQPVFQREEKLRLLTQLPATCTASRQLNMRSAVSSRAKAMFQM